MPLVKVKPTSPGRRALVKVVNPDLYKGKPYPTLVESQSRKAGRNNHGHITTRHKGGGHKQHYRIMTFAGTKMVFRQRSKDWNTIRTGRPISRCFVMQMESGVTSLRRKVLALGRPF